MNDFLKSILSDVDNMSSSKRVVLLWVAIVVWSFVHVIVFLHYKNFSPDLPGTLIMYDFLLIMGALGIVVSEKIWGRDKTDNTNNTKP